MSAAQDKHPGKPVYYRVHHELIQAAQYRGTTTYQDTAVIVGLPTPGNYVGEEVGHILSAISKDEQRASKPLLSALAVTKDDPWRRFLSACA